MIHLYTDVSFCFTPDANYNYNYNTNYNTNYNSNNKNIYNNNINPSTCWFRADALPQRAMIT